MVRCMERTVHAQPETAIQPPSGGLPNRQTDHSSSDARPVSAPGVKPEIFAAPTAETALLSAGQSGDPAALEQLLALHKPALYGLCRGILGHAEDAEDAVQETFLRALRGLCRFRGEAS